MGGVDAGVEHRHLHAGAVPAGCPGRRRTDLRHAVLQRRTNLPVQPDPSDAGAEPGRSPAGDTLPGRAGERGPQTTEVALADPECRAVDAFQRPGVGGAGERLHPPGGLLLVAHDQRQRALLGVAVPVGGQLLHIEEVGVEDPAGDVGQDVARQHSQPAVDLQGLEDDALAPGSRRTVAATRPGAAVANSTWSPVISVMRTGAAPGTGVPAVGPVGWRAVRRTPVRRGRPPTRRPLRRRASVGTSACDAPLLLQARHP
ncbi:hypothetical protein NKG94_17770 [Micromonospora sp. M12]